MLFLYGALNPCWFTFSVVSFCWGFGAQHSALLPVLQLCGLSKQSWRIAESPYLFMVCRVSCCHTVSEVTGTVQPRSSISEGTKERELEKLTAWGFTFVTEWLKSEFFLGVRAGRSYVWIILPVCAVHHCKGPVLWHLLGLVGIGCLYFRGGGRICDCTYLSIFSKC